MKYFTSTRCLTLLKMAHQFGTPRAYDILIPVWIWGRLCRFNPPFSPLDSHLTAAVFGLPYAILVAARSQFTGDRAELYRCIPDPRGVCISSSSGFLGSYIVHSTDILIRRECVRSGPPVPHTRAHAQPSR
ncbi:hypothetical protein GY45DRAFT_490528 [Cubamyces sp. BRFM 1775]|nr:hypothetical protein GY45DRAFT_490528 [Cubamyces sp. BRFM 1775]